MYLLDIAVRKDWEAVARQRFAESLAIWRWSVGVVGGSIGVVLLVALAPGLAPLRSYFQFLLVPLAPLGVAFAVLYHYTPQARALLIRVGVGLSLTIVGLTVLSARLGWTEDTPLPWWMTIGIAALNWGTIALFCRRFPDLMHTAGFTSRGWLLHALTGGVVGLGFGLHLLFAAGVTRTAPPTHYLWSLVYLAGLRSLSEELLVRGLGVRVLMDGMGLSLGQTVLRLMLLSGMINALLVIGSPIPVLALLHLVYSLLLSPIFTVMRVRRQSLAPALAGNVAFNLSVLSLTW